VLHKDSKKRRQYFSRHIAIPQKTRNVEAVKIYYKKGLQFLSIRYINFVPRVSGEEVIYCAQRYTSIQIAKGLNYVEGAQLCYYKHQL
jgi:CRISPR/Cas system-associated protein Cas7 (RAMP superfamily)